MDPALVSRCRYRGVDGAKCAAGFLIPDDKYSEDLEVYLADSQAPEFRDVVEYSLEQKGLVRALQRAHDSSVTASSNHEFVSQFRDKATMIAYAVGLDFTATSIF